MQLLCDQTGCVVTSSNRSLACSAVVLSNAPRPLAFSPISRRAARYFVDERSSSLPVRPGVHPPRPPGPGARQETVRAHHADARSRRRATATTPASKCRGWRRPVIAAWGWGWRPVERRWREPTRVRCCVPPCVRVGALSKGAGSLTYLQFQHLWEQLNNI